MNIKFRCSTSMEGFGELSHWMTELQQKHLGMLRTLMTLKEIYVLVK